MCCFIFCLCFFVVVVAGLLVGGSGLCLLLVGFFRVRSRFQDCALKGLTGPATFRKKTKNLLVGPLALDSQAENLAPKTTQLREHKA